MTNKDLISLDEPEAERRAVDVAEVAKQPCFFSEAEKATSKERADKAEGAVACSARARVVTSSPLAHHAEIFFAPERAEPVR